MSSDALTNLLNSIEEIKPMMTFQDFYFRKWNEEVTPNCKIQTPNGICRMTDSLCCYENCYRRASFHVNY
jgi:hypothetical protein